MHRRQFLAKVASLLLLAISPMASRGSDVLQNVPPDALGFVVIRNIAKTDAKLAQLIKAFQSEFPGPLAFLKLATGVGEGLDPQGDFLLAVLPGEGAADQPRFGVWLPVSDYARLVGALDGTPGPGITAVNVAGEDLLVAQRDTWLLVMDTDQRERMAGMLAAERQPPTQIATWQNWIDTNDVTAVVLPGGLHASWAWAAATHSAAGMSPQQPANEAGNDLFGPAADEESPIEGQTDISGAPNDIASELRQTIRRVVSSSPKLAQWANETSAVGCGVRIDALGNALAGLRMAWPNDSGFAHRDDGDEDSAKLALPPALYQSGGFVVSGAGHVPQPVAVVAADAFVGLLVDDLKTEELITPDEATVARFQQAVERATGQVASAVVLSALGEKQEGVYTNSFLAVRTKAAPAFVDEMMDAMRLWNKMNRDAEDATRLIFDMDEVKIGDRDATQYSLDIAAADGAPALPEIRQAMEKLFGPGGKLRLLIVPVDDQTVLLAAATPEQTAAMLQVLDLKQPIAWDGEELKQANRLLPPQTDWRLFVSPSGYSRWLSRQMDAIVGPVFGGPLVREFPASPPVGLAGGFGEHELWVDVAVPAETIQGAGAYLQKQK